MTIDFTRLQQLAAYINALPPEQFNLSILIQGHTTCRTVACAMGHATVAFPHWWPRVDFNWHGAAWYLPVPDGLRETHLYPEAAEHAFGIDTLQSLALFDVAGDSTYDRDAPSGFNDRELFLYRVHRFFTEHDRTLELV